MPRIHPCVKRRLELLCVGLMSLPPEAQTAYMRYMTEQVDRAERARWRLLAQSTPPAEEVPADGTNGDATRRFYEQAPLTAAFCGVGWILMAILNAACAGFFNPVT